MFYVKSTITGPPNSGDSLSLSDRIPREERATSIEDIIKEAHYSILIVEDNLVNVIPICLYHAEILY
jgi:hypothetical protein